MDAPKKEYSNEELRKDMKEIVWENRIQTLAVILVFFWGVETIRDLTKKK